MSILSFAKKLTQRSAPAASPPASKKEARTEATPQPKSEERAAAPAAVLLDLSPVVTEKSVRLQENGIVAFRVPHTATKEMVARAIRARFNVQPKQIRMVRGRGKWRQRGRTLGQTAQWKKVYVTVDDVTALTGTP
jgi:large subunit ribosomal protein L23